MYFQKRYECEVRNETGKLVAICEFSTPEDFDRYFTQYPPMKGQKITLLDLFTSLDDFGLLHKTVREITGDCPV